MSSSSYQSAHSTPSHCFCGFRVVRKQSWIGRNLGRRFVCCKFSNPYTDDEGCKFFDWVDSEMTDWQRSLINQLMLEKKLLEKEKEMLKTEVCKLQDQNSNLVGDSEIMKRKYNVLAEKKCKGKRNSTYVNWLIGFCVLAVIMGMFAVCRMV